MINAIYHCPGTGTVLEQVGTTKPNSVHENGTIIVHGTWKVLTPGHLHPHDNPVDQVSSFMAIMGTEVVELAPTKVIFLKELNRRLHQEKNLTTVDELLEDWSRELRPREPFSEFLKKF